MKKVLCLFMFLFSLNIFLIPVFANEIDVKIESTNITEVKKELYPGDEFSLTFDVNFSGLEKNSNFGVATVIFSLDYDTSVFVPVETYSKEWDTFIAKEEGITLVTGLIKEESSDDATCSDGILYCTNYSVTIKFFVKKSKQTEAIIKMGDIVVGLLDANKISENLTTEDFVYITDTATSISYINIKYGNDDKLEIPNDIIKEENDLKDIISTIIPNNNHNNIDNSTTPSKSYNNYLSLIEIEGYTIKFNKYKKIYVINTKDDINSLNINVTTEDSKASYKIIGAEDLIENENKVYIEVTAEDGSKETYTIKVNKEKETTTDDTYKKTLLDIDINIKKEYFIITGIVIASIFLIISIVKFILHRKDRKLEKELDKL